MWQVIGSSCTNNRAPQLLGTSTPHELSSAGLDPAKETKHNEPRGGYLGAQLVISYS